MGYKWLSDGEKQNIVLMRQRGLSLREISRDSCRSKATIAGLVRGVRVLPEYLDLWNQKRGGSKARATKRWELAEKHAINLLSDPATHDALIICSCLYWAEGNKKDFVLTNTDPEMVRVFVRYLVRLGLDKSRLRINIRVYQDINQESAGNYWAGIVGIPSKQIGNFNVLEGKKAGKLEFGMCRLRLTRGEDYFKLLLSTVKLIGLNNVPIAQWIRATDS